MSPRQSLAKWFSPDSDPLLWTCPCRRPECDAPKEPARTLLFHLDRMRDMLGQAIIVTSGVRCAWYNAQLPGAVSDSEHTTGEGADLSCETSATRWKMLDAARAAGFTRIGIYRRHLHVGVSDALVDNVVWVG